MYLKRGNYINCILNGVSKIKDGKEKAVSFLRISVSSFGGRFVLEVWTREGLVLVVSLVDGFVIVGV